MEEIKQEKKYLGLLNFYEKYYKKLLIIPFLLLILAISQIVIQTITTGDFINKGVSLKGGVTVTIPEITDINKLQSDLKETFKKADISVRELSSAGTQIGVIIDASDIKGEELINELVKLGFKKGDLGIEETGASLGESFFKETFRAIIIAFVFMGLVVFLYFSENLKSKFIVGILSLIIASLVFFIDNLIFNLLAVLLGIALVYFYLKHSIPSIAVILAAFSDIIVTLAIVNLFGIKLSTAGIAAFLMLIGYSVDTDILLSTRVLKRKEKSIFERIMGAMKTGLTMNGTTLVAVIIALFITDSYVIRQIMIILLIGLFVDIINTWIQNAGILRLYLEKKFKTKDE
jgi:preprotein translocase subunit SecF